MVGPSSPGICLKERLMNRGVGRMLASLRECTRRTGKEGEKLVESWQERNMEWKAWSQER